MPHHRPWSVLTTVRNKKFELMLTGRAKAYSSFCSQTLSLSPAISSRLLRGYRSLMLSCVSFLEPRKSRLGPSKSTFNAKNTYGACPCLSQLVSAQFALTVCLAARHRQKIHKTPYFGVQGDFRSLNPIESHVYEFLLVINSNLSPISHRYWDTATYWPKIANFGHPLSFSALVWGDPLQIHRKALRFLKLESSWQPTVKTWWS